MHDGKKSNASSTMRDKAIIGGRYRSNAFQEKILNVIEEVKVWANIHKEKNTEYTPPSLSEISKKAGVSNSSFYTKNQIQFKQKILATLSELQINTFKHDDEPLKPIKKQSQKELLSAYRKQTFILRDEVSFLGLKIKSMRETISLQNKKITSLEETIKTQMEYISKFNDEVLKKNSDNIIRLR